MSAGVGATRQAPHCTHATAGVLLRPVPTVCNMPQKTEGNVRLPQGAAGDDTPAPAGRRLVSVIDPKPARPVVVIFDDPIRADAQPSRPAAARLLAWYRTAKAGA